MNKQGSQLVFDNKFFLLLVNFLWMIGLFGTLFTIAYAVQYRRKRWWNVGHSSDVPRTLIPLHLALTIFCVGLMLHASLTNHPISAVVMLVWGGVALLFLIRFVLAVGTGIRLGWDAPMTAQGVALLGWRRLLRRPTLVLFLLLCNVTLLGWWGNVQLNAEPATAQATPPLAERIATTLGPLVLADSATRSDTTERQLLTPRINLTKTVSLTTTAVTIAALDSDMEGTVAEGSPASAGFAVVTMVPEQLRVTPTPIVPAAVAAVGTTIEQGNENQTPVATATPVPTLAVIVTPSPTPLLAVTGRVNSPYGANLRVAPTTAAAIVTTLPDETNLQILGVSSAIGRLLYQNW